MMFRQPIAMSRALDSQVVKVMLPTGLRSNMLAQLSPEVRKRSFFIAGETSADVLQTVDDAILHVLSGEQTEEGARAALQALPELLSNPRLQSDGRARLILETNIDLARGYGGYAQTQDPDILEEFPAWEFYRAEARKEIRDWPERWAAAGGRFFPGRSDYPEGRMIALKDDPIWEAISAFDLPYAPFDYNSGMDLMDVDRDEAEALGLIGRNGHVQPARLSFNHGFEAHPSAKGPILAALEGFMQEAGFTAVQNGVMKLGGFQ
jgi:hypothetical protein